MTKAATSPFTGASSVEAWGRKDGRPIYVCPDTRAVFFDRDDLRDDEADSVSPGNYDGYYPYLADFDAERVQWEIGIRRSKYQKQLALMKRCAGASCLGSAPRLLDVGAGPGYLVAVAEEEGWEALGVEISPDAVAFGQKHYSVRYIGLDDAEDEAFDALTCHHVLEHVEAPMDFLRTLVSKLRPGGLLVLHVPHQRPLTFALRDRLAKLRSGGESETFCRLYGDIHIQGFTVDSLRAAAKVAGLNPHFVRSKGMWSSFYDPFFWGNYAREGQWGTAAKKAIRHAIDFAGVPFGLGDWVVGYFHKPEAV